MAVRTGNTTMPPKCKRYKTQKALTILGAFLLLAPATVFYDWGNLSTYVLSYIHMYSPSLAGAQTFWVSYLYLVAEGITLLAAEPLIQVVGKRIAAFIGAVLHSTGVLTSYFAVDVSMFLVNINLGVLCGLGAGLLMAVCAKYGVQWSSERETGTVMGIIFNSYTAMAICVNQFITWYINPLEELPYTKSGDFTFFSQEDIISRIPNLFLILGTCYATFQVLGILMVRDSTLPSTSHSHTSSQAENVDEERSLTVAGSGRPEVGKGTGSSSEDKDALSLSSSLSQDIYEISPRQMLCTPSFYLLCLAYASNEFVLVTISASYKAFGQMWINDDYFLARLGMASVIFIVVSKTLAGIMIDKVGCKYVLMVYYGTIALCTSFFYMAPQWSKWFYCVVSVLVMSICGSAFLVHSVSVIKLFGRKHMVINVGLMNCASIVSMIIAAPANALLMDFYGWPGIFYTEAVLGVMGFIVVTFGIPKRV